MAALSNVNGEIVERYSYDVFGEPNRQSDVDNPYLFTGRRFDEETGLYYYRARYYAPDIGRFLQTDPIGYATGFNLYTYCGNSPLNWVDPYGWFFYGFREITGHYQGHARIWGAPPVLPPPGIVPLVSATTEELVRDTMIAGAWGIMWGPVDDLVGFPISPFIPPPGAITITPWPIVPDPSEPPIACK